MTYNFEHECDIYGPIDQARRCLDQWLKQESRALPAKAKERTAALMARYFYYEDQVSDQLMLSFLRHYSGKKDIDVEDPASVRMKIKELLDQSTPCNSAPFYGRARKVAVGAFGGILVAVMLIFQWNFSHMKITQRQQNDLKSIVHQISLSDPKLSEVSVWARLKKDTDIRRYEDMSYWDYERSKKTLEGWLQEAGGAGDRP